jgi:hypothetical protein
MPTALDNRRRIQRKLLSSLVQKLVIALRFLAQADEKESINGA